MSSQGASPKAYFDAIYRALDGLNTFLREEGSPAYKHDLVGAVASSYLKRLRASFECWENRISFSGRFRISRSESGFPAYQNVLDLDKDRREAEHRLATLPSEETIREEMVDFILRKKAFPTALKKTMAERQYLQIIQKSKHFEPLVLPRTIRVSVNPKTRRPYYVVHWGYYDGSENLPLIYMLTVEDSSEEIVRTLVTKKGKLNGDVEVPLPVDGLLNPELAHQFDEFCEKNSSYGLTLSTIATSLDKDFDHLHPKQLRRVVLGPFYHAAITEHGERVERILQKVRKRKNAWLISWAVQEIYSYNEKPAKWGLWGSQPAREEFYINTDDLDCAREGVSSSEKHVLVPHEAYQALFATDEADEIFGQYHKHVLSGEQILRNM